MAEAKGHKFGQALGNYCQTAIEPMLKDFAAKHGLFLDKAGPRSARKGKKLLWVDEYENAHELDFVLERGGIESKVGTPVAFVESAWRRYTKHSRNKAQEIQGAVMPLRDRYKHSAPMMGAILAGVWTSGAVEQLRRLGFKVLYFPYETVVASFDTVGIDVRFDENTPESEFDKKFASLGKLSDDQRRSVWEHLLELNKKEVGEFMSALEACVQRQIEIVRVIPLHGAAVDCKSITEALEFIGHYSETDKTYPLAKYEVQIRYSNGDKVDGQFQSKATATDFLNHYKTGNWRPLDKAEEEDLFKILEEMSDE